MNDRLLPPVSEYIAKWHDVVPIELDVLMPLLEQRFTDLSEVFSPRRHSGCDVVPVSRAQFSEKSKQMNIASPELAYAHLRSSLDQLFLESQGLAVSEAFVLAENSGLTHGYPALTNLGLADVLALREQIAQKQYSVQLPNSDTDMLLERLVYAGTDKTPSVHTRNPLSVVIENQLPKTIAQTQLSELSYTPPYTNVDSHTPLGYAWQDFLCVEHEYVDFVHKVLQNDLGEDGLQLGFTGNTCEKLVAGDLSLADFKVESLRVVSEYRRFLPELLYVI